MASAIPLAARGVSKSFFGNPVLREVSIALAPGAFTRSSARTARASRRSSISCRGRSSPTGAPSRSTARAASKLTPSEASRAGIAVVQQELSLTNTLSIAENIGIGAYPRRLGLVDYGALAAARP